MRKVCYSVAMSLDGYVAGPQGEFDWIVMDPEFDFRELMNRFDTLVMGRKTWEMVVAHRGGPGMPGMRSYVFSRTLSQDGVKGATVSADLEGTMRALIAQDGKDIWLFGGGELFAGMLDRKLVHTLRIAVVPVLLGGGLPVLAPPAGRAKLALLSRRTYEKTGTVLLEYAVAG